MSTKPQVEVSTVQDLWPQSKWTRAKRWPEYEPAPPTVDAVAASLKDLSLARVVDSALTRDPERTQWMQDAAEIPDFRPALRAKALGHPSMLNPRSKAPVLGIAFEGCDVVDLAAIEALQPSELLEIVKHVSAAQPTPSESTLILPNMRNLTASFLKEVLDSAPITGLDLGSTAVSLKGLLNVVKASKVKKIYCPALYKRAFQVEISGAAPPHMTGGLYKPSIASAIFPSGAGTSFPLVQFIYVRQQRAGSHPRLHSGGLHWERLLQLYKCANLGGTHDRDRDGDGMPPNVLVMPLQDALWSTEKIVEAIPKLLKQCLKIPDKQLGPGCFSKGTAAKALALSMSITVRRLLTTLSSKPLTR
jgi:hypothetical protein